MKLLIAFIILFVAIISSQLHFFSNKPENFSNYLSCQNQVLDMCRVPTLNSDKCFLSEFDKCPRYNGSYMQCTNNYKSLDQVCECQNRGFEVCPLHYKVSEKCYQENLAEKCGQFNPTVKSNNPANPRINMFNASVSNPLLTEQRLVLY